MKEKRKEGSSFLHLGCKSEWTKVEGLSIHQTQSQALQKTLKGCGWWWEPNMKGRDMGIGGECFGRREKLSRYQRRSDDRPTINTARILTLSFLSWDGNQSIFICHNHRFIYFSVLWPPIPNVLSKNPLYFNWKSLRFITKPLMWHSIYNVQIR